MIRALLRGVAFIAFLTSAAGAVETQSVRDVAGMKMLVLTPAATPAGSVLLIPGGDNRLSFPSSGTIRPGGNFLVRSRDKFVAAGYVTAMLDNPRDVSAAVVALHAIAAPVFVIGTSTGTVVAADAAVGLKAAGAAGIILTSSVTRQTQAFSHGVDTGPLERANLPVLFLHNTGDACRVSPLAPVQTMVSNLGAIASLQTLTSSEATSDPCEAFAPHGYLGIEADAVNAITTWMALTAEAPKP
jgi:hypothetical protein